MIAEIISIGDELLIGQIVNSNSSFIASVLNLAGIKVRRISAIGDNRDEILAALNRASEHAELVIITGGLGPTNDDITKKTLCEYFESHLILNQQSLDDITRLFASRGMEVSERNRQQAELPHNCRALRNTLGTAPGMWFIKNRIHTIALPGVPYEMKQILCDSVLPELKRMGILQPFIHKTVLTMGMAESTLADHIKEWEDQLPDDIKLAYLPEAGIIKLRLSCYANGMGDAEGKIDKEIKKLDKVIPGLIFGFNKDTIQQVTGNLLLQQNKTVCTAESCTGGYIAHLITSVAGSSKYYKGSVVAYDNEIKIHTLGVDKTLLQKHGAVSREVVSAMAAHARKLMSTDYAIATSGIAGPDGGTKEKPVGTIWIAIASEEKVVAELCLMGDERDRNIRRTGLFALNMLRKELERGQQP